MEIMLSKDESAALQQALKSYCSDLRMEIADTDNAEFRRGLREERALLETVVGKLDAAVAESEERDHEGSVIVRVISVWST
ncbi:MAG: hypothetical protein AB7Q42_19920 [Acidimicrobiia bacterium]